MSYTNGLDKPSDYFNTVLYTGNASTNAITGVGFQPDWVWLKNRSSAYHHRLFDSVRGTTKNLSSNRTDAESTESGLTSFDSDGFTLGSDGGANNNTDNYVAWNWLAGGTASSNTDGSITSSVSANTTAGFSIVTYTGNGVSGATVGHGLSTTAPKVVLIKKRNAADPWTMLNTNVDLQKYMRLDSTTGAVSDPMFNNTAPTTSVFTVDADGQVNGNTNTFVAYCFSEVKGYSKFGSYTGNGSTDGPMIWTGFKPAWVLQKSTAVQGWQLQDNKREGYNGDNDLLQPHDSAAESGVNRIDILSNGFKVITTDAGQNTSGQTYIYMCFAESPFVTSTGIPTTAR